MIYSRIISGILGQMILQISWNKVQFSSQGIQGSNLFSEIIGVLKLLGQEGSVSQVIGTRSLGDQESYLNKIMRVRTQECRDGCQSQIIIAVLGGSYSKSFKFVTREDRDLETYQQLFNRVFDSIIWKWRVLVLNKMIRLGRGETNCDL